MTVILEPSRGRFIEIALISLFVVSGIYAPLTYSNSSQLMEVVIVVSTPQNLALMIVAKAVNMLGQQMCLCLAYREHGLLNLPTPRS